VIQQTSGIDLILALQDSFAVIRRIVFTPNGMLAQAWHPNDQ
jgi:hypothetical protein